MIYCVLTYLRNTTNITYVASDLRYFTMNNLVARRNCKLYSIARSIVFNSADVFFQGGSCFGEDSPRLVDGPQYFLQPLKIRTVLLRDRPCLRFFHQLIDSIFDKSFQLRSGNIEAALVLVQAVA